MSLAQIHSLVNRARERTAPAPDTDDDFVSGFRHFRQANSARADHGSRPKKRTVFTVKVVCLDGPHYSEINPGIIRKMNEKNLGSRTLTVLRSIDFSDLKQQFKELFNLTGTFVLKKAQLEEETGKIKLKNIVGETVREVKLNCKRSKIYILPNEKIENGDGSEATPQQDMELDIQLSRPARQARPRAQRSSSIRTLAVIANAAAELMEETDSDDLPDPGFGSSVPRQRNQSSTGRRTTHEMNEVNADEAQDRNGETVGQRRNMVQRGHGRSLSSPRAQATRNNIESPRGVRRGRARRRGRVLSRTLRTNEINENEELAEPELHNISDNSIVKDTTTVTLSPIPRQAESFSTEERVFQTAGTPTIEFRSSTPVQLDRAIADINTADVICLDVTRENNIQVAEIADFIPESLPHVDSGIPTPLNELKDIIQSHRADFISSDVENPLLIEVRRDFVMDDALGLIRVSQADLNRPLHISFIGEDGVDLGGLRREFWSLFVHQLAHSIFVTGKPGSLTFRKNYMERKKETFFYLGQLVSLSILEDGPGLPIFAESVTDQLLEECIKGLHLNDLSDVIQEKLREIDDCVSDDAIKDRYEEMEEERTEVDFLVPIHKFRKEMIPAFKSALVENVVSSCKEELDQFIKGLDTHQVLSLLRQEDHRKKARGLFSGKARPLTALVLRKLLNFKYSEGNRRLGEMKTGHGFITFLQAAASKGTESKASVNGIVVTLEDILMWLSGARTIPAAGFHKKIDVEFSNAVIVNTCALSLTLKIEENLTPDEAITHYAGLLINSQTFTME